LGHPKEATLSRRSLPTAAAAIVLAGLAAPFASAQTDPTRLSRDVVPTFESVRLSVDPTRPEFTGAVHVELKVVRPASTFAFHAEGPVVSALKLRGPAGEVSARQAAGGRGVVRVQTDRPLAPGAYTLDLEFKAPFDTHSVGLYRTEAGPDWYAYTQFEATDARRAFPCWDEPSFKIPYQITLTVPAANLAVSNTPVESETPAGASKTIVFKRTPPLPSYLLAVAVGPFDTVPITGMSVPGRVVTVKGKGGLAAEAARVTPPLLGALERYFGRPYPFEKLDLLAVPEYWPGAMENPGAITFADAILLIDPKGASVAQRRTLIEVTAHEIAHMWFGDLVTMAWWDDLWLNESFASWMGDKVTQEAFKETEVETRSVEGAQKAMNTERLTTRSIRQPVGAMDNLLQAADELAYQKGEAVLGMFEAWLGPDAFRKGIRDYLAAHEWGNATAADLWGALSKASGKDVGKAMGTFLDQPGVPVVTALLVDDGKAVRLTQQRFVLAGVKAPPALWQIPVGVKFSDGGVVQTKTFLLTSASQDFKLGVQNKLVDWIHPNAGERGYYRWSVARPLLTTMAEEAATRLDTRERIGFVGNLSALLDAGLLHGGDYLRLLASFAADPDPLVVSAVMTALDEARTALVTAETRQAFATYVQRTLGKALERIGPAPRPGEAESAAALRPTLLWWLAVYGSDPRIQAYATELVNAYFANPGQADPGTSGVALEIVAATAGDRALFDRIRKRLETATVPVERTRLFAALGRLRDPALAEEALSIPGMTFQEGGAIIKTMAASAEGSQRVFAYHRRHYDELAQRLPPMFLAFLPNYALGQACSEDRLTAVHAFYADPKRNVAGTDKELAMREEEVRGCIGLRTREAPSAAMYLRTIDPR
jgi:alanyl aminopeptidase